MFDCLFMFQIPAECLGALAISPTAHKLNHYQHITPEGRIYPSGEVIRSDYMERMGTEKHRNGGNHHNNHTHTHNHNHNHNGPKNYMELGLFMA